MLVLQSITGPLDSRAAFSSFNPDRETWIVSDLKSKLDLNRKLLASRSFISGDSVLRVSDFWKILLGRLRPDLQVVSREFIITLIAQKLLKSEHAWAKNPGAAQAACDYLTQLMPVLAHPNGEEMLHEWFAANPASEARWRRWFDLALELWREFLLDGFVMPAWASGVLANESDLNETWREIWTRPLVVDLGPELDQVEADLLVQLSEYLEVKILRPEPEWRGEYRRALVAYEIFERKLQGKRRSRAAPPPPPEPPPEPSPEPSPVAAAKPRRYRKYTTMIAEVKDAVAQTRIWLDSGQVRTEQVAIVAPDIEIYWPALSGYLEQEGIPCQKDRVRRLHAFSDIARWLATLRLRTSSYSEADLELELFESESTSTRLIEFERFKVLYSSLYGREDLNRLESVAERFKVDIHTDDEPCRDDFVAWSLKLLPVTVDTSRVESLFKRFFSECPQSLALPVSRWLAFIEQLAARIECRVKTGDADGVACVSLSSSENSPASHMIILGLTEGALKSANGRAILFSDIGSIENQLGFHLSSDEQSSLEFTARWLIEDPERKLVLSVPETDFAGGAQAPSWLWVRGEREMGGAAQKSGGATVSVPVIVTVPSPTRWDEVQYADLQQIFQDRRWPEAHAKQLNQALSEDLGLARPEVFASGVIDALSPSAIEDYLECPFIFAAKRLFALSDVAELDLEVDAIRRGNLMHKLFEILTGEPRRFSPGDDELEAVVVQARSECELQLADERLWPMLKTRHKDLARRFLAFENEDRFRFPGVKTLARELKISGFIDPQTGSLVRETRPGAIKFVGRIDRVDIDENGNVAIYDYKSSAASAAQFGSWLKNNKIQLLLYAMAIEQGLADIGPHPVLAALYYVARPLGKDSGFKTEEVPQGLYDCSDKRKRNRVGDTGRAELFGEAKKRILAAVSGIQAGQFAPQPRDHKKCIDCKWSSLCRAPHLN